MAINMIDGLCGIFVAKTMVDDPITVRCFDSFAQARSDAAGRLDGDAQPGPFDRLDWFEVLHESAFSGERPRILCARRGDSSAWLFLTGHAGASLQGIANWYSFVFRPQFDQAPIREDRLALIGAIAAELRGMSPHLRFHPIVDDGMMDDVLMAQAFRAAGWRVVSRVMAHKRLLALASGTSFADYWAARPGLLRSTFARKARRHPLEISIHREVDDALWAAFEQVFGASWKPDGDDFGFLRGFAEREAAEGRLRLGIGGIEGAPVAVELWTIDQGRAYIHKLAFDERFAEASPGTQLSHAMFRQAIDGDRVTLIDYGTGDNDYKAAWMPDAVPMRQIDAFDMRRPASWQPALAAWISALSSPREGGGRLDAKSGGGRRAALDAASQRKS